jgi:hypothetical protein
MISGRHDLRLPFNKAIPAMFGMTEQSLNRTSIRARRLAAIYGEAIHPLGAQSSKCIIRVGRTVPTPTSAKGLRDVLHYFLTGWNVEIPTIVSMALANQNAAFQPITGQRWINGNLKMVTNSRPLDRLGPTIEKETTVLAAVRAVLSWAHTSEPAVEDLCGTVVLG